MALRFWGTAGGDERNEYLLSDVGAVDFAVYGEQWAGLEKL